MLAFLVGFTDGTVNIMCFKVLGFEFESQSEPFGVYNIMQGVASAVFQLALGALDSDKANLLLIFSFGCFLFGIFSALLLLRFRYK